MFIAGYKKVCCCVVKLISFEIYEQDKAKKATIEDYLANFVITNNTLRHSSQAAKKFVMDYVRDGKIQGQCTFKKTKEWPCISPSLT